MTMGRADRGAEKRRASFEKAKGKRREDILAAAEALIRKTGSTDFSMRDLAEEAGVSPYTTYNLIGTKSEVFYILLNKSIDSISGRLTHGASNDDPVQQVFVAGAAVADVFDSEAEFYRPLMRHLLGVLDPVHRPAYMKRAFEYWLAAFAPLEALGLLRNGASAVSMARTVQVLFTGAIDYWVHGEISGVELREQMRLGLAICLQSENLPQWSPMLEQIVGETEQVVARQASRLLEHGPGGG